MKHRNLTIGQCYVEQGYTRTNNIIWNVWQRKITHDEVIRVFHEKAQAVQFVEARNNA
tara:strand:+ start:1482 stop:1655 length:174 start_codon:yes stop_codon:yes gene_type:complete